MLHPTYIYQSLFYYFKPCKLQQQLLFSRIAEAYRCLTVISTSFNFNNLAYTETFVFYLLSGTNSIYSRRRSRSSDRSFRRRDSTQHTWSSRLDEATRFFGNFTSIKHRRRIARYIPRSIRIHLTAKTLRPLFYLSGNDILLRQVQISGIYIFYETARITEFHLTVFKASLGKRQRTVFFRTGNSFIVS